MSVDSTDEVSKAEGSRGYFNKLPKELRLQILGFCDLSGPPNEQIDYHSIVVHNWRLFPGNHHIGPDTKGYPCNGEKCPNPLSRSLLLVSRQFYQDCREVFFSQNRIVLASNMVGNLEFLRSLSEHERLSLRKVTIRFTQCMYRDHEDDFLHYNNPDSFCCFIRDPRQWDTLVQYIWNHLNISKLELAIDLGGFDSETMIFDSGVEAPVTLAISKRAFERLIIPFRSLSTRPKDCWVFLPWHSALEDVFEKTIMGPKYDSLAGGKQPAKMRCNYIPCEPPPATLKSDDKPDWEHYDWAEVERVNHFRFSKMKAHWQRTLEEDLENCTIPEAWPTKPVLVMPKIREA